ncbi:hypothetical protein F5B17DRAFT_344195 [Nemania serpens]|nr:hypothetical protein F5B17DRAFT_344195 [Nemania serpens]
MGKGRSCSNCIFCFWVTVCYMDCLYTQSLTAYAHIHKLEGSREERHKWRKRKARMIWLKDLGCQVASIFKCWLQKAYYEMINI